MAALHREIREIDIIVHEIELSLDSALVHVLSIHVPAVKRIARLKQKNIDLDAQLAVLRLEAISTKARSRLAEDLADTLASNVFRKDSELESLEMIAIFTASSLRQVVNG